jgi:gas vesicle protein
MEEVMKKVSLAGVILGVILGAMAALLSGSWLLWLGLGLAIGVVVGAAQARRGRPDAVEGQQAKS